MNVRAIADLHGHLPQVDACDLLLIAGDICPTYNHDPAFQVAWLDLHFRRWLERLSVTHVVAIAGNHDLVFLQRELVPALPWIYLRDSGAQVAGLRIYGTPWTPTLAGWAFEADEPDLERVWARIPSGLDILITHTPPRGYGDGIPRYDWSSSGQSERRVGSPSLVSAIDRSRPQLAVFGHIHEGRGRWRRGNTQLANVTVVDAEYNLAYPAMDFQLQPRAGSA